MTNSPSQFDIMFLLIMCKAISESELTGRDPNNPAIIKRNTPLWELVLKLIKDASQSRPQQSGHSTEDSSSH